MSLKVQDYLRSSGKTLTTLKDEFGIDHKYHSDLPFVLLQYSQIDSPKTHEIVRECRSLVLRPHNWDLISGCMLRFFNLGEVPRIQRHFNWDNYQYLSKEDGSLISLFSYNDELVVRTKFSWADTECGDSKKTWKELVLSCLTSAQQEYIKANPHLTFVFELCSPWNQVVVYYPESKLYLITVIDNFTGKELYYGDTEVIAQSFCFNRPEAYNFESIEEMYDYLNELEASKLTQEGFVLTDNSMMRLKVKNAFYLNLHRLNNNGNISSDKILVDVINKGEEDEVILYYPHLKQRISEVKDILSKEYNKLFEIWWKCQDIDEQKKFAIYITKDNRTPFSGILFELRKEHGRFHDECYLREKWLNSKELILKVLF